VLDSNPPKRRFYNKPTRHHITEDGIVHKNLKSYRDRSCSNSLYRLHSEQKGLKSTSVISCFAELSCKRVRVTGRPQRIRETSCHFAWCVSEVCRILVTNALSELLQLLGSRLQSWRMLDRGRRGKCVQEFFSRGQNSKQTRDDKRPMNC
jgi:hypothetical protein